MKRVTFCYSDPEGQYVDKDLNKYSVSSGMYSTADIASMSNVWTPIIENDSIVLGPQASPNTRVGVCYHNISQALQWLGLSNA